MRSLAERCAFDRIPCAEESIESRLVADDPHNDAPSSAHHTAANQDPFLKAWSTSIHIGNREAGDATSVLPFFPSVLPVSFWLGRILPRTMLPRVSCPRGKNRVTAVCESQRYSAGRSDMAARLKKARKAPPKRTKDAPTIQTCNKMSGSILISQRTFGGYGSRKGVLEVEGIDVDKRILTSDAAFSTAVSKVLLGQTATTDIRRMRWGSFETVVYAGETIARLHIATILEHYRDIDFGSNTWVAALQDAEKDAVQRIRRRTIMDGGGAVRIELWLKESEQSSATLHISGLAAQWLGEQLRGIADGTTDQAVLFFDPKQGTESVAVKSKSTMSAARKRVARKKTRRAKTR